MKKLSIKFTIVLNFVFFISTAQNWKPVNSMETFNFVSSVSQKLPVPIWVDSISANGSDTIYYLNRFVKSCKNCISNTRDFSCYPYTYPDVVYLKDQGDFLQKKIKKEGDVYRFYGKDTFAIAPFVQVNEPWVFDTTNSVTAHIGSTSILPVLGTQDEIKTILLSNQDTIILSKNFGIIYFTRHALNKYWKLAGIEERGLGLVNPQEDDYYNFEVGDMFEYIKIGYGNELGSTREKYEIKSKEVNGNTFTYHITGCRKVSPGYSSQDFYSIIDYKISYTTKRVNKRLPLAITGNCGIQYEELKTDTNGVISHIINPDLGVIIYHSDTVLKRFYINGGNVESMMTTIYKVGLGKTYSHSSGGNYAFEEKLVAYRKNNDTVGTFTDTKELSSVFTASPTKIAFSPNPASDRVKFNLPSVDEYRITITDVSGKIMTKINTYLTEGEINISMLPAGMYIVSLEAPTSKFTGLLCIDK